MNSRLRTALSVIIVSTLIQISAAKFEETQSWAATGLPLYRVSAKKNHFITASQGSISARTFNIFYVDLVNETAASIKSGVAPFKSI